MTPARFTPGQRLQDVPGHRSLQREQRVPRARVHRDGVTKASDLLGDPVEVFHDVRRVDDQHEVLVRQLVRQHIVDERALRRRQRRILNLVNRELRHIVRRDVLDGRDRIGARDLDLPHVADIEQSGTGPDGHVLVGNPGVFDRHVPAAERDHSRPEGSVARIERSLLERAGGRLGHQLYSGDWGGATGHRVLRGLPDPRRSYAARRGSRQRRSGHKRTTCRPERADEP